MFSIRGRLFGLVLLTGSMVWLVTQNEKDSGDLAGTRLDLRPLSAGRSPSLTTEKPTRPNQPTGVALTRLEAGEGPLGE